MMINYCLHHDSEMNSMTVYNEMVGNALSFDFAQGRLLHTLHNS